jgi:exopolyphosphatase/guanosine-5'-triphosphate,3'-diphosphate pyrophosphatase
MCFETVTRANMGGIDHQGRLFLAWAIRSRYKGGAGDAPALLSGDAIETARCLGLAMRLGAMISGAQAVMLQDTALSLHGDDLVLVLNTKARALLGEVLEKRFQNLAKAMGRKPVLDLR